MTLDNTSPRKNEDKELNMLELMSKEELYLRKKDLERDIRAFPMSRDLYLDRWKIVNDEIERRADS